MNKKLVLTLDEATTKKYLELASKQTEALVDEDCEPSDVSVTIDISANQTYDNTVFFGRVEIGIATIDWTDV